MKKLLTALAGLLLVACNTDNYDSGDGDLSYLRADFVEAHTSAPMTIDRAVNDEGTDIFLATPLKAQWATKADTTYRALLYYNNVKNAAEPLSVAQVFVLTPKKAEDIEGGAKTDPVVFDSAWLSENKRYINLGLQLKTGKSDDQDAIQTIGIVRDDDRDDVLSFTFVHNQGNIPEYYSSRIYVSIAVDAAMHGKTVVLHVNSYDGPVERSFQID